MLDFIFVTEKQNVHEKDWRITTIRERKSIQNGRMARKHAFAHLVRKTRQKHPVDN